MESKRFHWYLIFLGNLNYILFEIINRVLGISDKFLYSLHSLQNFKPHIRFPNIEKMPIILRNSVILQYFF